MTQSTQRELYIYIRYNYTLYACRTKTATTDKYIEQYTAQVHAVTPTNQYRKNELFFYIFGSFCNWRTRQRISCNNYLEKEVSSA